MAWRFQVKPRECFLFVCLVGLFTQTLSCFITNCPPGKRSGTNSEVLFSRQVRIRSGLSGKPVLSVPCRRGSVSKGVADGIARCSGDGKKKKLCFGPLYACTASERLCVLEQQLKMHSLTKSFDTSIHINYLVALQSFRKGFDLNLCLVLPAAISHDLSSIVIVEVVIRMSRMMVLIFFFGNALRCG